ncbi:hypothetical protein ACKWTF_015370 [Chironomus riparius]
MKNIKNIFKKYEISKILNPVKNECFLANPTNDIQTHQLLWKIYRTFIGPPNYENFDKQFLSTIIFNAVTCSAEIFEFTWNEIKAGIKDEFNNNPESVIEAVQTRKDKETIFHVCVKQKDKKLLKVLWMEVEELYESQLMTEHFKYFIMDVENVYKWPNILVHASKIDDVEFHEVLWKLLLNTFGNSEDFKNGLITFIGYYGIFMFYYVKNSSFAVNKFLIQFLKDNFNDIQLQELIKSRSKLNVPNFLQNCIQELHNKFEIFKIWWEFLKKVFQNSEQFLEFIKQENAIAFAFTFAGAESLKFMFNDLKTMLTHEAIKKILCNMDENVLKLSIRGQKGSRSYRHEDVIKSYKTAWQIVNEYFDKQEISVMAQAGSNLLHLAFDYDSVELIDFLWQELKKVLNFRDQIKYLRVEDTKKGNLYQCSSSNPWHEKELKLWIENIFLNYKIKFNK